MATQDFLAKITQITDFFAFPNFTKLSKFATSTERPKTKSALVSEGSSDQGLRSWTPPGFCLQTPDAPPDVAG